MSKHIGNVVDPWTVLNKQGADAVRWYFYTGSAPWLPSRFYPEAVSEAQRKFMGTLWNAYAFFVLYADIDGYDPSKYDVNTVKLSVMDKWILSKLNTLVGAVDKGLDKYQIFETSRMLQDYADELSNWYIRRGRERYWGKEMTEDKAAAYTTLYTVLVTLAKISAPFVPFIAESIYQNLVPAFYKDAPISVHLCSFPEMDESKIDKDLENGMSVVLDVVMLGRATRNTSNIKNRQPLQKLFVATERANALSEDLITIAKEELNVKDLEILTDAKGFISYKLKPQLKTLGPKYGAKLGLIRQFLETCDAGKVVETVKSGVPYSVELGGGVVEFTVDDLLISSESKEGYVSASENGVTVVLDTTITKELLFEGIEREIVSKIQTMRKEAGFEVTDRIYVYYQAEGDALTVLTEKGADIGSDVLAVSVTQTSEVKGFTKEWDIVGSKVTLGVEKA
jgi:isoleucyl-tRNA synthetase